MATVTTVMEMRKLVNGYQVTQAISVAVSLGLADRLADGSRTSSDLAEQTSADPEALYRLMRALASVGILLEHDDRRFELTELGSLLRSDSPQSIAGWAAFVGDAVHWQTWGALRHSIMTGETAFSHVYGTDAWTYRSEHPETSAVFDRAMMSLSSQVAANVAAEFDFSRFKTIVDVGGGNGRLLGAILSANPGSRGVLFDLPHVVASSGPVLTGAGVADRCEVIGGSFFDAVPTGGDAYVLKHVLHDWEDDDCRLILASCRAAMEPGAAILLIERELGGPNDRWDAKFSDLNMLTGPGGKERTVYQYAALLTSAGFKFIGARLCSGGHNVIEGIANR